MNDGEVRTVSATGGEKGVKPARFDLIPAGPLTQVAEHYGRGAQKYDARNWERGYEWSKSFGALMRHAWAFWNGEDLDPETESHHMAAVAFHAFALIEFADTHPEFDDRPTTETRRKVERDRMVREAIAAQVPGVEFPGLERTGMHTITVIDGPTGERKEITALDYPTRTP